jgi:acid stress-induced BolA-like protein IbaG/YrbA
MLENTEIKSLIQSELAGSEVAVEGDGYHYQVSVVSDEFESLSRVQRQKRIYKILGDKVKSGELHALSIKTFTHAEWEVARHG